MLPILLVLPPGPPIYLPSHRTEATGLSLAGYASNMSTEKSNDIEAHATAPATRPDNVSDLKHEHEQQHLGTLNRDLKSRHIQFLALSGAIGTGLFVGSGQVISLAGPLSAFLAYAITGANVFCVVHSLGEMGTYLPVPGAVPTFATRYVDPALGFVLR